MPPSPSATTVRPETDVRASSGRAVRADIQALRAYAAMAVVLYHFWPTAVPGGFIGVDVFFVISGFLITTHLVDEAERTGRVRLLRFWARRIRRLLPASTLVLAVSLVVVLLATPRVLWGLNLSDIRASAVYLQNWALASDSVDYLAAENSPGVAQHYWSLAVEEQFYLVWPLLILGALAVVRRRPGVSSSTAVAAGLGLVTAASFVFGVVFTHTDPAAAFFNTFTRAWEFGVGGLIAVAGLTARLSPRVRAVAAWASVVVLLGAAVVVTGESVEFPGWVALVPAGAAAVFIVAGEPDVSWAPTRLYRARVLQWLGDHSYAVYLWHWPMVVLTPWLIRAEPGPAAPFVWLAVTPVLAWATKRWVEDPLRRGNGLRRGPAAFVFAVVVPGMLVAATTAGLRAVEQGVRESSAEAGAALAADPPCFGAAALTDGCDDAFRRPPDLDSAFAADDYERSHYGCQVEAPSSELRLCRFGQTEGPTFRVALVGNSHAVHLVPALVEYGESRGWEVLLAAQTDCMGVDVAPAGGQSAGCAARSRALPERLTQEGVDVVVVASHDNSEAYLAGAEATDASRRLATERTVATWGEYERRGLPVLVLGDVPGTRPHPAPECVMLPTDPQDPCAIPRDDVVRDNLLVTIAKDHPDLVNHHDLADLMCDEDTCHALVGGVVVYRDAHHLTTTYARTVAQAVGTLAEAAAR